MKKFHVFLAAFLFFAGSMAANAQAKTGADYFVGKWVVLLKALPQGDTKMVFNLEKKDDKLVGGAITDTAGVEISKVDKVEVTETSVTLYFTAQGYDVNLVLNKKDDDHVTGSLMGMFDAEGERKKEEKAAAKLH